MVCKDLAEEVVSGCGSWPHCRVGNPSLWILSLRVDPIKSPVEGEHTSVLSELEVIEVGPAAPVPEAGVLVGMQ